MSTASEAQSLPPRDQVAARWLPIAAVLLHLSTSQRYGYFRDELYYLACGEHLGFGYVEHPPLIGWIAAAVRATLGDSLPAIRALPAIAGAAVVALTAAIARELGGGSFAQRLAALCALLAPGYLGLFGILSMNAFDLLVWASCWLVVARILRTGEQRLWLVFGLLAGIGLENKISVLFLGFGVAVALLVDRRWVALRARWLWLGALVAALLFLPHVLWQWTRDWPVREFIDNAQREKMLAMSPAEFLAQLSLELGPAQLLVWLPGVAYLLFAERAKRFRMLAWATIAIVVLLTSTRSKPYYALPAFTVLFAGGAVAWERFAQRGWRTRLRPVLIGVALVAGLALMPFAKPLLSPDVFVRYASWTGVQASSGERHAMGRLPQHFADMHGWPELAASVAAVYHALPEHDRERARVFGQNYGEAGAIDLFGPELGLPSALSAHNSYFLWGPGDWSGEVLIVIGDQRERLLELFESVELAATFDCTDCMPYEDEQPIWVCRKLRMPVAELWPAIKRFI